MAASWLTACALTDACECFETGKRLRAKPIREAVIAKEQARRRADQRAMGELELFMGNAKSLTAKSRFENMS
jgi:hypothetical protein